ncbi:MAG: RNA-binding cell elongation regulator Jag/EloR [Dehalococcoidia bacterium]|nr:RNA-binding cell elongation regulator Jag/EloR [Dehalococcoidia bacterium]
MEILEVSAKTVDGAIKKALDQLGVGRDDVEITVLSEGRGGILGIGAEEARIRVEPQKRPQASIADITREVLEALLSKMGVTATVVSVSQTFAPEEEGGQAPIAFDIRGEDLGILIGRRGQTLACLQYIVRLITSQKAKAWVPIIIDVEGYKQRRYDALKALALQVADRIKTGQTPFEFEPMTAYERRIIHLTLANNPDVTTQSVGEGEARKVTAIPRKK